MKQAVLIISHGSRSKKTKEEVVHLLDALRLTDDQIIFEYAFLELEEPSISEGIELCAKKGATDILVLLNFLNSGRHVDEDIPQIVDESRKQFPDINIKISSPVGQHPKIVELFQDLIQTS